MKRILAFVALAGFTVVSQADVRFEFGLQPDYIQMTLRNTAITTTVGSGNFKNIPDKRLTGINPYIGLFFNDYFGMEFDYIKTQTQGKTSTELGVDVKTVTDLTAYSLQFLPRLPAGSSGRFAFLSSFGVGSYKVTNKGELEDGTVVSYGTFNAVSSTSLSMGVGAQYQFTDLWGVRFMSRYIPVSFAGYGKCLWITSLGLNFRY